jgi:hypothetical protein
MTVARRGTLHELARQLQTVPTPVLGFVTTDAGEELASGHGYGYGYGQYGYAHPSKAPSGSGV